MTDRLPARHISLSEFRANPCAILGTAIDADEVILIGYDVRAETASDNGRPLAVLVGWDLWQRLAGTEADDEGDEPSDEPDEPRDAAQGDGAERATEPASDDTTPAAPAPVPVTGQPGWWCCAVPGCAGVTDEVGGRCEVCGATEDDSA